MPHQKNGFQLRHLKKAASFHRQLGWEVKRDAFQFSASQEASLLLPLLLVVVVVVVPKLPPSSALYTWGLGGFRHPLKSLQNPSWDSKRHSMTRTQLDLPFLSSSVVQQPQEGGRGTSWGSLSCPLPAGSTLPEKRSVQQVTSGQEGTPHLHPIPSGEGL